MQPVVPNGSNLGVLTGDGSLAILGVGVGRIGDFVGGGVWIGRMNSGHSWTEIKYDENQIRLFFFYLERILKNFSARVGLVQYPVWAPKLNINS